MSLYLDGTLGLSASAGSAVLNNTGNNVVLTAQSLSASTVTASTSIGIGTSTPTTALQVNGVVTMGDGSQFMTAASFGMRNRIINGAMQISQRQATGSGATITSSGSGVFGPDRWWTLASITSVATVFQVATGAYDFPYAMRVQRGNGQASTPILYAGQTIESYNCVDLSSQTVTLSFYATAGANYSGGSASVQLWTGTGTDQGTLSLNSATWTGQTQILNAAFTPTTTRTRFSFTIPVGAGIGEMAVRWSWVTTGTAGAADYIDFTGCQLELGPVATPFERKLYDQVLVDCQRYYYRMTAANQSSMFGSGLVYSTSIAIGYIPFPVQMRIAPVALEQSGTAANYEIYSPGGYTTSTSVPVLNSGDTWNATVQFIASGYTAGQGTILRAASASAYLGFSAEL